MLIISCLNTRRNVKFTSESRSCVGSSCGQRLCKGFVDFSADRVTAFGGGSVTCGPASPSQTKRDLSSQCRDILKKTTSNCQYASFLQTSEIQSTNQNQTKQSCLEMADKIWQIFHRHNPQTHKLHCSSNIYTFLINVAPFKRK